MEDLTGSRMAWSRGPVSPGTAVSYQAGGCWLSDQDTEGDLPPTPPWFLRHHRRLPAAVTRDEFSREQDVEKHCRDFPSFFSPPRPGLGSSPWWPWCVSHACTHPHATVLSPRSSIWTIILPRAVASWLDSFSQAQILLLFLIQPLESPHLGPGCH